MKIKHSYAVKLKENLEQKKKKWEQEAPSSQRLVTSSQILCEIGKLHN